MDFIIGAIILLLEFVIGICIAVPLIQTFRGEMEPSLKGVVLWILGCVIMLILWYLHQQYIPDSGIVYEPRRT